MRGEQFYRGLMRMINEAFSGMEFFAYATDSKEDLTRFYESKIHQNTSTDSSNLVVVAVKSGKFALVESDDFSKDSLNRLREVAEEMLESSPEPPFKPKLPPLRLDYPHDEADPDMLKVKPKDRAEVFDLIKSRADSNGLKAYGFVSTEVGEMAVMSSNGLFLYQTRSMAQFNAILLNENGTGSYTSGFARNLTGLNVERKIDSMIDLARKNVPKDEIDTGKYTVVLGPEAVATLFTYFAMAAANGFHYELGTSSAVRYLGEKIGPDFLTFKDDPTDSRQIPVHFDIAGIKRERFDIIEGGVFKNLMYSFGAHLMFGKDPTGHTVSLSSLEAVFPMNPVIDGGNVSKESLFSKVDKGLYIHRLHYVNVVDLSKLVLTGMTRDGLFLIEDGEISRAVKNMRFNISFYDLVKNIVALSEETETVSGYVGFVAPYALVDGFSFTSKTDH